MAFTELCYELSQRIRNRGNIEVDDRSDVIFEESDNLLNIMSIVDVEEYIYNYGLMETLEQYDSRYGLDSLNGMEKIRRVKYLLQCIVMEELESSDDWWNENQEEVSQEGSG